MLRRVRAHAHGLRLHDALTTSPLTIVYQCIGNVKAAQLEEALRADVAGSPAGEAAAPVSFRVKNSLASAAGRADVAAFLQATNVLVGWELRAAQCDAKTRLALRAVREADRLTELTASAQLAAAPRQPPQRTLAPLIKASLRLGAKFPVAPLAGFFHGSRVRLDDLARWGDLDDATVYGELLAQLGAVPHGLVQTLSTGDAGISEMLDAQARPLLAALAARGSTASLPGGPAVAS